MSFLDCRDQVTKFLNDNFVGQFEAESTERPVTDFIDIIDTKVFVSPMESQTILFARNTMQEIYTIQVGVIRKVNATVTPAQVLALAEAIKKSLHNINLPVASAALVYGWFDIKFIPFYDYQSLDEDKVIMSIIQIQYKEFTG